MKNSIDTLITHTTLMHFLIVEDDKEFQANLVTLLQDFSINLKIASDGEEALECYKMSPYQYDILFVDINLPKLNGLDLIHKIREINAGQVICVISAYLETNIFLKCIHFGINEYLVKPLELNKFLDSMNSMVAAILFKKHTSKSDIQKHHQEEKYFEYEKIETYLTTIKKHASITLVLCNLDHFYLINQELGYAIGDKILKKINHIFKKIAFRKNIQFFQCIGDEFCFVLLEDKNTSMVFVHEIQSYLRDVAIENIRSIPIYVTASFGIAYGSEIANLLANANIALKKAKKRNLANQICVFDRTLNDPQSLSNLLPVMHDIRQAIKNQNIIPYYQAVVDVLHKEIMGYECLARMQDAQGNIILPATFLPVVKRMGLINHLTRILIDKCFQYIQDTKKKHYKSIKVGLNISMDDLLRMDFVSYLQQKINQYSIDPSLIVLEILEDIFLDANPIIIFNLHKLKEIGFKLAIDDFGMEQSNLNRFDFIGFDFIKMDGHYIYDIDINKRHQAIVESIVHIASKLNMKVIAEYVHNEEIYKIIKKLGVHDAQGFYIHQPSQEMLI